MDVSALKNYIAENDKVEDILKSLGCHDIKKHGNCFRCANPDGDNVGACNVFLPSLSVVNYTRDLDSISEYHDLFTLVQFYRECSFFDALKYVCECLGISTYYDFDEGLPKSIILTKQLLHMINEDSTSEQDCKLKPISEKILSYYYPCVNDFFKNDGISYKVQKLFQIGYDASTNRITIPIRNYDGVLVGVKGRWFGDIPKNSDIQKYVYIEPCNKGQILFGLDKTYNAIMHEHICYVGESEKFVMQLYSYGVLNVVSTGGKTITRHQIEMLSRMCVDVVLCFDQDVEKTELQNIANRFLGNVNVFAMIDEEGLLNEHESPSDNIDNWDLLKKRIIKLR